MKTLKITPPEGYEIDYYKSTFDEIVFKEVKKRLPDSWGELESVRGYYVCNNSIVETTSWEVADLRNKNIFHSEAEAKASIALAQLSQLRAVARGGWVPDWEDDNNVKWTIYIDAKNILDVNNFYYVNRYLSFQSKEIAQEFLEKYKNLIEEASPLLFG